MRKTLFVLLAVGMMLTACAPRGEVGGGGVDTPTATALGDCPPNADACIRPPTPTPFQPATKTPEPRPVTATPWVYPTAIFTDAVEPPVPQPYYFDRAKAPEHQGWVFVLLGTDAMPHRRDLERTDTFIIVLVNVQRQPHVSIVSVPRDMHIFLPGYGMTRINAVWTLRGAEGLRDTLRYNFGLPMDAYILTRMNVLEEFIDEVLGKVTVDVPEAVYDYCGDRLIDMLPGPHEMDGALAVCYARVRLQSSDYPRMLRQQSLLLGMRDRALELAGTDPFGFFIAAFRYATNMGLETSVGFFDLVEFLWPVFQFDLSSLKEPPSQYRMMPPFSVHFNHPVTGAWLLAPPTGACMETLIDLAWVGEPWLNDKGESVVEECER